MTSSSVDRSSKRESPTAQLVPVVVYILVVALIVWAPFVFFVVGLNPFGLFATLESLVAALMYLAGSILASSTAVGGGIVFNPMLQVFFRIGGLSALCLAVIVQCTGMTSGTYGWYKDGAFRHVNRHHLLAMVLCASGSTFLFSFLLLLATASIPIGVLLSSMKLASALVSFYVALLLWSEIKIRKALPADEDPDSHADPGTIPLDVDWRIYPWIGFGALLNVTTAVGMGGLTFSHLMRYYRAPARQSIAMGVMLQAVSVICQTAIILTFMGGYVIVSLVCIGLLVTMAGGRLAPYLMTRKIVEPYVKHALAVTAFGMGMTSVGLLVFSYF